MGYRSTPIKMLMMYRYTRITYEDAFPETASDELANLISTVDLDSILTFHVHLRNFKLLSFTNVTHSLSIIMSDKLRDVHCKHGWGRLL